MSDNQDYRLGGGGARLDVRRSGALMRSPETGWPVRQRAKRKVRVSYWAVAAAWMVVGLLLRVGVRADDRGDVAGDESRSSLTEEQIKTVSSSRVLIRYALAPGSARVQKVDLWYTTDRGKTWRLYQLPDGAVSPLSFDADEDGLYGFHIVLHNAAGASSPPPGGGTAPQYWVRVDRAAPTVQVLTMRPDPQFAHTREILIRWEARDENLPNRPVSLHYRTLGTKTYRLIAESLAAKSSYRWTVPEGVIGRVELKVDAVDRAGNRGQYVADWVRIEGGEVPMSPPPQWQSTGQAEEDKPPELAVVEPGQEKGEWRKVRANGEHQTPQAPRPGVLPAGLSGAEVGYGEPDAGIVTKVPSEAAQEAQKRYDLGTWHRLRGEYDLAIARYRQALEQDPNLLAARCDLGGVLLLEGECRAAEREFRRVLEKDGKHLGALKSLALVQATLKNYESAGSTLDRLLELDPTDAEAWLHLGDVRLFLGEREAARAAWRHACEVEGAPPAIVRRAEKRLSLYGGRPSAKQ